MKRSSATACSQVQHTSIYVARSPTPHTQMRPAYSRPRATTKPAPSLPCSMKPLSLGRPPQASHPERPHHHACHASPHGPGWRRLRLDIASCDQGEGGRCRCGRLSTGGRAKGAVGDQEHRQAGKASMSGAPTSAQLYRAQLVCPPQAAKQNRHSRHVSNSTLVDCVEKAPPALQHPTTSLSTPSHPLAQLTSLWP